MADEAKRSLVDVLCDTPSPAVISPARSGELPGRYNVTVYAYDPASGNTGVDHLTLTVTEE